MTDANQTTGTSVPEQEIAEAVVDGAPVGRNYYFYIGWLSHKDGHRFEARAITDWRWGWREREKLSPHRSLGGYRQ